MYSFEIREKFGTENLVVVWFYICFALFTSLAGCEPTKNKSKLFTFGTSLSYACVLWILVFMSFKDPTLLGDIWIDDIYTFRYASLTISILCLIICPTYGHLYVDLVRFNFFRFACISGDMKALRRMIENSKNINFNALDLFNRNGFLLACEYNQCQVVKFLFKNASHIDLDFNQPNGLGQSGFHMASMNKHRNILALILQYSADVGIDLGQKDNDGKTGFELSEDLFQLTENGMELKPINPSYKKYK